MELWLDEVLELKNGRALKVKIKSHIHSERTPFQMIDVFDTVGFGRVFTLDGVMMMTEFDEFAYHEMIAHVPLMRHPNPERVLVIGGGDGGTVREVLKHSTVKEVHLCEIDKGVVDVCLKFFPDISNAMLNPKVKKVYEDGAKYVEDYKDYFDVILVDSSDPIGPAEVLFQEPFYRALSASLRKNGIITSQAESFYYHGSIISNMFQFIRKIFAQPGYYYTVVPTYPSGIIGFTYCSNDLDPYDFGSISNRNLNSLTYYTKEIHQAAFSLPKFAQKFIQ